jgi:hypothetical protein
MSIKEDGGKSLRDRFRPTLFAQNIHQLESYDPAYEYRNVIFTYRHAPDNVDVHLNRGWEIVETTSSTVDDRSFTPNSKEKKLRPQPCVTKTRDKHEQVLMRILKTTRMQNNIDDNDERKRLNLQDAKRRGDKIVKRGNETIIKGAELNDGYQEINEPEINFNDI